MAGSSSDSRSSAECGREILDDWNLGEGSDDLGADTPEPDRDERAAGEDPSVQKNPALHPPTTPHISWELLDRADSGAPRPVSSPGKAVPQSAELLAGFELEGSERDWGSTVARRPHHEAAGPETPARGSAARASGQVDASSSRGTVGSLRPGDVLAGFRIILELGRGAFARVYLAEEVSLGRRAVAIKVSRPEGDEPQILARLQHTHIVPVHSVCDDPQSGLRVLCMPYFGGANLAQVLEASGGLIPTHHDGRSLVKALDQVSRNYTSVSSRPAGPVGPAGSAGRGRAWRTDQTTAPCPPLFSADKQSLSSSSSRFGSLFSRWVGPRVVPSASVEEQEGDHDKPSRQFLHGASAVQAAVWIVARLADGLEHAHSRGLLHRDLKPSNILLAGDGTPMLLDFNLSVESLPFTGETEIQRAFVGGTLPYMAPEHLDAFNPRGSTHPDAVDERSDIYALGLILFEMMAGDAPFPEPPSAGSMLESIQQLYASRRKVPSLRARCPDIPWSLDALVAKCLAFDPSQRYARARDLAEDLHRFLEHLPMKHGPEPSFRERMGKFARRHPGLCGATSITLIALVLIAFLGATIVMGHRILQDIYARVQIRRFDRNFTEIQFLLNSASDSDENLKRGLAKASKELAHLEGETGLPPLTEGWPTRVTLVERRRLREQLVELIMLDARARVTRAKRHGSEDDRREAVEGAIRRLDDAETIDPAAPSALYAERARYYAALGLAEKADADRKRAAARVPTTCHDLTLAGTTLFAAGDCAGAERALRQALQVEMTSFWTWYVLGHCHFAQRRYLEAAGDFGACAARDPTFAWVHFNRGLALAKAGRLLDAQVSYDRALEIDPKFTEALVNRALVELELNDLERARDDLTAAIKRGRDDLVVFAALGETWSRLGRREESERYFASLLERDPSNLIVRVARGITRIHTNPTGAEGDFRDVLEQDDRNAQAHYGMALLVRKDDLKKALDHLDRALDSNANLIDALQLRALVRAKLGERGALDDVDRLVESATANRLYNGACAVAILSETTADPRLVSHAMDLLTQAIRSGFPAREAAVDPDLKPLRASPRFDQLMKGVGGFRRRG